MYKYRHWLVPVLLPVLLLVPLGCGKEEPPHPGPAGPPRAAAHPSPPQSPQSPEIAFLDQPFESAIQPHFPQGTRRPPDETVTGKSIGKLYEEVKRLWPTIRFVSPANTALETVATVETEHGNVEIVLRPDVAPNHARAFVALAKAGYYDGLFFETRLGNRDLVLQPQAIAGGSPEADGRDAGSIGFWLKPEILLPDRAAARGVRHEAGTVFTTMLGCRFYIGLNSAPMWDGDYVIFGHVRSGMDVVRKLYNDLGKESPAGTPPTDPPLIRKVTISQTDTGKPWPKIGE